MTKLWDDMIICIGEHSDVILIIGVALIMIATGWDILQYGIRGFFEYSVCWKGMAINFVGALLVVVSWRIERSLNR